MPIEERRVIDCINIHSHSGHFWHRDPSRLRDMSARNKRKCHYFIGNKGNEDGTVYQTIPIKEIATKGTNNSIDIFLLGDLIKDAPNQKQLESLIESCYRNCLDHVISAGRIFFESLKLGYASNSRLHKARNEATCRLTDHYYANTIESERVVKLNLSFLSQEGHDHLPTLRETFTYHEGYNPKDPIKKYTTNFVYDPNGIILNIFRGDIREEQLIGLSMGELTYIEFLIDPEVIKSKIKLKPISQNTTKEAKNNLAVTELRYNQEFS